MTKAGIDSSKLPLSIWIAALASGLCAAILFSVWPELDLQASALFYQANGQFLLVGNPLGTIPRVVFIYFFVGFSAICLFGLFYTIIRRRALGSFDIPHWAYLVACLVIGPGILTNTILKDNWGRARPVQIEQFGAGGKFTPALVPSTACKRNCSFVSGESSSIFMVFFSLALLLANYRKWLFTFGILIGSLSGLVRMGMGGHFLSDVIFSGIFMLLTASALYWLIFNKFPRTTS